MEELMLILITVLLTVAGTIICFFKVRYQFWKNNGFEFEPPVLPWGNAMGLTTKRNFGQVVNDVYNNHVNKRFVGMFLFHKPVLLIRDPELVKNILVRDFTTFHDRGIYVNEKDDPLSAHLFFLRGAKWKYTRTKVTPTFTSGKMKMMYPIMVDCSKRLNNILDGPADRGEVIEIKDYAARYTTDIISLAAFGIETDSLHNPNAEFRYFGQRIFELTVMDAAKQMIQSFIPWLGRLLKLTINKKDVAEFFLEAFRESMNFREDNKIKRNDFMDLLIQLKQKGKLDDSDDIEGEASKFSFEETAAQAFAFFVAGFETSSTTMQFAIYELAKNTDIQEKARTNIAEILERWHGEFTYESLNEMEYLERVIAETLRMYPPLPFLQRECNKEFPIPATNLTIPKNVGVLIDTIGLHHDPQYFPNPKEFDPDRFTEDEKLKRHKYTYLPFGAGPRNCIGMRFGLMQTKIGLASLLMNFEFSVAEKTPVPLVFDATSFITSPKGGMHIRINKVQQVKPIYSML